MGELGDETGRFSPHINGMNYAIDSHSISNQKIIGTDNNKSSESPFISTNFLKVYSTEEV